MLYRTCLIGSMIRYRKLLGTMQHVGIYSLFVKYKYSKNIRRSNVFSIFICAPYPAINSAKTFTGEEKKFHNLLNVHNAPLS